MPSYRKIVPKIEMVIPKAAIRLPFFAFAGFPSILIPKMKLIAPIMYMMSNIDCFIYLLCNNCVFKIGNWLKMVLYSTL